MVIESLVNPFTMTKNPYKLIFLGFFYCSIASLLAMWIFKSYASMIMVFFTTMACLPLVIKSIKEEEKKDLQDLEEKFLLKEHAKALECFMFLFVGILLAAALWFVVLPSETVGVLFEAQSNTIKAINGGVTGLSIADSLKIFTHIFSNNLKVLVFCILFSFLYGAGAMFILAWNASVIGVAIGNFIRAGLSRASDVFGFDKISHYFGVISIGLFKYAIHGIPEILAYFTAGLAGGIISVAVIRHDFGTRKFEHVLLDSADLLLLSLGLLFLAALLEVYVTPIIFT
ncbi:MAG: stage II sporulation protein M [Candidatus Woesearchaeota archaeon]